MERSQRFGLEDPFKQEERGEDEATGWPGKRSLTQTMSSSTGGGLPGALRGQLESGLGTDLGGVRVHIDGAAARAAQSLNARAFTLGQAVYFGAGQYDPGSAGGQRLIAHEVAHTVQQRGAVGAAPQRDGYDVSSPGDFHEVEAESFATSFVASGGKQPTRAATMTPVSRGTIARAVIQRDLLEGASASKPQVQPVKPPSAADITQQVVELLKKARGDKGTPGIVSEVQTLRSSATPTTAGPIENAINGELNSDEKKAITVSPTATANANANAPNPGAKDEQKAADANKPAAAPETATKGAPTTANANAATGTGTATEAKDGGPANAAATNAAQPGDQPPVHASESAAAAAKTGTKGGEPKADEAKAKEAKGAEPAKSAEPGKGAAPANAPAAAGAPAADAGAGQRDLIEQELAFHDRWKMYSQNGAGGRAAHLAGTLFVGDGPGGLGSKLLQGDLVQGAGGAAIQTGAGLGLKVLATKTFLSKIPGVGSIIGGGLSAWALAGHGGAGAKKLATSISKGIGGAFSAKNWSESPWLTAANLVEGIKSTLELIGHIANILAGLAYILAGVAVLLALIPGLQAVAAAIPVLLNFGRACSGIATICFAVGTLLSPIIPVFRAMHQIFSDQDPIKLADQENEYHDSVTTALANYGAAKANEGIVKATAGKPVAGQTPDPPPKKVLGSTFIGGNVEEMQDGKDAVRSSLDVANTRAAIGGSNPKEIAHNYINPEERVKLAEQQHEEEEGKLGKKEDMLKRSQGVQDKLEQKADKAVTRRDANPTERNVNSAGNAADAAEAHEAVVARQEAKVDAQHEQVERAEWRAQIPTGRIGEENVGGVVGDAAPGAISAEVEEYKLGRKKVVKKAAEAKKAEEDELAKEAKARSDRHEEQKGDGQAEGAKEGAPEKKDGKGHVVLPDPPGNLTEIDALDAQIKQLEAASPQIAASSKEAHQLQQQATQQATGLKASAAGVTQEVQQNQQRSQTEQKRITTQTTDLQGQTAQAHGQTSQGTDKASWPLRAIAGTARIVDGLFQHVPSNRFFDISAAKNNVHHFVEGMDQVMGAGGKQKDLQGQTDGAVGQRTQQTQQAAATNQQANASGQKLAEQMHTDSAVAQNASTQAAGVAQEAQAAGQQNSQSLAQLRSSRKQKWDALLGWAANHRELREKAAGPE
jgi:hypothetical protein